MDSEIRRPRQRASTKASDDEAGSSPEPKIEELLRQGEALLRAGRPEQAIHVWTRILFLDRGNPVARTAIDEAKRVLAERQRELDVMVLEAARSLRVGDRKAAKTLLGRVLRVDPRHTEGRSLWEKLESLERRGEAPSLSFGGDLEAEETSSRRRRRAGKTGAVKRRRSGAASPLKMAAFVFCALCLLALGGVYLHLNWDVLVNDSAFASSSQPSFGAGDERDTALVPTVSELHYYNGVRLYTKGRYRQALFELERVERSSGVFEEARSLMLRIEERLLRDSVSAEPPPARASTAESR